MGTNSDKAEWRLLATDLITHIAPLPILSSQIYHQLNAPGSGELKIPLDHGLTISKGMFCQLFYRGSARGGFFVENSQEVEAASGEAGARVLSLSGRGALALLAREIVWAGDDAKATRTFNSSTKAAILITLIDEAQARGGLANFTYSFTSTEDSAATPWTDSEDYDIQVGKDLLSLAQQFAATGGFDFSLDLTAGTFTLGAYAAGIGSDVHSTTHFRIGENCEEVGNDEQAGPDLVNAYLIKHQNGYASLADSASVTAHGRSEGFINIEQAQSAESALTYGAAKLAITKDPLANKSIKVYDGVDPRVYVDYDLGDYIGVDRFGTESSDRLLGIRLTLDGVDFAHATLEFNAIIDERDITMQQQLDDLAAQWATAHDSNLLEVRQWLNIGLPNGNVNASFIYNGSLYVFGNFTQIGNIAATRAAKYNLSTGAWSALSTGIATEVLYATVIGTTIYATTRTTVNKYASGVWSTVGTLSLGEIRCIATDGTNLFVGGSFLSGGGLSSDKVAKWNGTTWSNSHAASYDCESLCWFGGLGNTVLYASLYTGVNTTNLQYYSAGAWHTLFTSQAKLCGGMGTDGNWVYWVLDTNHVVRYDGAGLTYDEDLGDLGFTSAGGIISGSVPTPYASHLTDVYIGRVGTADYPNGILKYSGGIFSQLGTGGITSGNVRTITINPSNGDVYIGGSYQGLNSQPINYLNVFVTSFESLVDHATVLDNNNNFDLGSTIHAATAASLTDASEIGFWDSVSQAFRKITLANVKAFFKTYFDTIYRSITASREKQTANTTYYVRTDGSDSNDGLTDSAGGAFLTIQHAVDVIKAYDWGGFFVTVQIGAGTFSETVNINALQFVGIGGLTFTGTLTQLDSLTNGVGAVQGSGATQGTVVRSTGTWTLNQRQNKIIRFTSGSNNGLSRIVDSNIAGATATIVGGWSGGAPANGDTFVVEDWGTIIRGFSISGGVSITFNNLKLGDGSSSVTGLSMTQKGVASINRCWVNQTPNTSVNGLLLTAYCTASLTDCYLDGGVTVAGDIVIQMQSSRANYARCKIFNPSKTKGRGIWSNGQCGGFITGCVIDGGLIGIYVSGATPYTLLSSIVNHVIRNCATGVQADTQSSVTGTATVSYSGNTADESATAASYGYID